MANRAKWLIASFALAILICVLWKIAADQRLVSRVILPHPFDTLASFRDGLQRGVLLDAAAETLTGMLAGWVTASLLGVLLGGLIAGSQRMSELLVPTLDFIRQIPSSAILPIAIMYLGFTSSMVVAVILFSAIWPVLLSTIHGFQSVEKRLLESCRVLEMGRLATFWKVSLPSALPDIFAGLRIGLTISLILAVASEILAGMNGIGHLLMEASVLYRSADLFAGVILIGLIGYLLNSILTISAIYLIKR